MEVAVRPKRRESIIPRRRERPARSSGERGSAPVGEATGVPVRDTAKARRRHRGGTPQDRAVYACQCGMVFEEHVSTSVGCPHCGRTQAW